MWDIGPSSLPSVVTEVPRLLCRFRVGHGSDGSNRPRLDPTRRTRELGVKPQKTNNKFFSRQEMRDLKESTKGLTKTTYDSDNEYRQNTPSDPSVLTVKTSVLLVPVTISRSTGGKPSRVLNFEDFRDTCNRNGKDSDTRVRDGQSARVVRRTSHLS